LSFNGLYINASQIVAAVICIFLVLKAKDLRADIVMLVYIVVINVLACIQLLVEPENPVDDFIFLFVVAFSFINRQYAVYFVGIVCTSTCFTFATIRYNDQVNLIEKLLKDDDFWNHQINNKVKLYIQVLLLLSIVFLWVAYAYNDELSKKL
jgi:hypothetical protein